MGRSSEWEGGVLVLHLHYFALDGRALDRVKGSIYDCCAELARDIDGLWVGYGCIRREGK